MKTDTRPVEFDMGDVSVMIGIPVNRDLPWQTAKSLLDTVCVLKDKRIPFDVQLLVGSSIVEVARSLVAKTFLQSKMNRLFMIDSDQSWDASAFMRLLALSTKMPVVVGPYPAKKEPPTFLISTIDGDVQMNEWGCLPVKGHGLGFTVVRREIIQALSDKAPRMELPGHATEVPFMFRCDIVDGVFRGEDMAFFADVMEMGHAVWMDPSIMVGHIGAREYKGDLMEAIHRV